MSMARSFSIDESLWPLLIVRHLGMPTDEHHEEFLAASASYARRGRPYLVLSDMLQAGMSTAAQRHRHLEWLARHDKLLRDNLIGMAFVMDSAFLRLALNVTIHCHPPVCPYIVVPRVDLALEWATARFEATGLRTAAERVRQYEPSCVSTGAA